jgi:F420-non-reducing hydrogenase small subunit
MSQAATKPAPQATKPAAKTKGKLAIYWAASCGGCEISILQIDAKILDVGNAFDVVLWPCAADGKVRDVEKLTDGEIDVCLFNGGVRTSEQEYMARLLRRKSKVLVAFGSCAQEGGIPGLGNTSDRKQIFDTVYKEGSSTVPDNPKDIRPQHETDMPEGKLYLPVFYDTLKTLDQTVDVDYYLPGCPPEADKIWNAITAILEGKLPPRGSVIGANTTVCDECKRKRTEKRIKKFHRTWQIIPNEEDCLLEQGLVCCGLATRAGCGALCPQVNSPCIGCHGPNEGVEDCGSRLLSAVASVIDSNEPAEIDRIIQDGIPDPVGMFYRFSLPSSLLRRKNKLQIAN